MVVDGEGEVGLGSIGSDKAAEGKCSDKEMEGDGGDKRPGKATPSQ